MGVVCPQADFLQQLRALCDQYHSVLIFDEVITGFRLGIDGAQGWFQVTPDLTTYGKLLAQACLWAHTEENVKLWRPFPLSVLFIRQVH